MRESGAFVPFGGRAGTKPRRKHSISSGDFPRHSACTGWGMPRQKLTWKEAKRHGKQGQVQPSGPHDPEHQEASVRPGKTDVRESRAAKKGANPRLVNKQSPL